MVRRGDQQHALDLAQLGQAGQEVVRGFRVITQPRVLRAGAVPAAEAVELVDEDDAERRR